MSKPSIALEYNRQDLRKATKFTEGDYRGINPRQFYRRLKRSLEEIRNGSQFKYQTVGDQETNLQIDSESVGQKTGTVSGRLAAYSEWNPITGAELEYRSYGPHGAIGLAVGGLLFFMGLFTETWVAFFGLIALVAGGYFYSRKEKGEIPLHRQDSIRVLQTGEVSERTVESGGETVTDIFSNMSVIYAGDSVVTVDHTLFAELDWPHRLAILAQVARWRNECVPVGQQVDVEDGFTDYLQAWSNKGIDRDIQKLHELQRPLTQHFELRAHYTSLILNLMPKGYQDELHDHQDQLLSELRDLADGMDIYVEREGIVAT